MSRAKGKLRHLAISVPDPDKAADFYMSAFGMEKVTSVKADMADGVYLTDGTINVALLRYKDDRPMGDGKTKDWFGVHHFGFWVDDVETTKTQIEEAGGRYHQCHSRFSSTIRPGRVPASQRKLLGPRAVVSRESEN